MRSQGREPGQRARVGHHVPGEGERHVLVVSERRKKENNYFWSTFFFQYMEHVRNRNVMIPKCLDPDPGLEAGTS